MLEFESKACAWFGEPDNVLQDEDPCRHLLERGCLQLWRAMSKLPWKLQEVSNIMNVEHSWREVGCSGNPSPERFHVGYKEQGPRSAEVPWGSHHWTTWPESQLWITEFNLCPPAPAFVLALVQLFFLCHYFSLYEWECLFCIIVGWKHHLFCCTAARR